MSLELLDVLTDVDTPNTTDNEDEDTPLLHPPTTRCIVELFQTILNVNAETVSESTSYAELYRQDCYKKKVIKKIKKMKKNARKCDFESVYYSNSFWEHYGRIRETYKDDGGRPGLNYLVALECHLDEPYSESESETESESEQQDAPPTKKRKFENKSDDNDDDDNNFNVGVLNQVSVAAV
jgi:hypothetical protein